jgi:hypothetical protein
VVENVIIAESLDVDVSLSNTRPPNSFQKSFDVVGCLAAKLKRNL